MNTITYDESQWVLVPRDKLTRWEADLRRAANAEPVLTQYQKGFMDACDMCSREVQAMLAAPTLAVKEG